MPHDSVNPAVFCHPVFNTKPAGCNDNESVSFFHYGRLLRGGAEIFEYQAALMHAKTMVIDGIWATIGSSNLDNRSFALNQEINLTVYDVSLARRLEEIFREDLKYSKKITYDDWNSRSIFERRTLRLSGKRAAPISFLIVGGGEVLDREENH